MPLPHPQTLQKLKVPIIDSEICGRLYWRGAGQGAITEDMLCAGYLEGERDACLVSTPPHSQPCPLDACRTGLHWVQSLIHLFIHPAYTELLRHPGPTLWKLALA